MCSKPKRTNLQAMRVRAGFKSAKAFAEHIGMPVGTYTNYEQGKAQYTLLQAWEFADELGCTIDELAGRRTPGQQLSYDEREIVHRYREVDDSAKRRIRRVVDGEVEDMDEAPLKNTAMA